MKSIRKIPLLMSSCLAGNKVRFDGGAKIIDEELFRLIEDIFKIFIFCPEIDSGLSAPRPPSEIRIIENDVRVFNSEGRDLTENFENGASTAVNICKNNGIKFALLKDKSPSCGSSRIYDGTFSGNLIKGEGLTATALKKEGISVFNESQISLLIEEANKKIRKEYES